RGEPKPRKAYDRADWKKIGEMVRIGVGHVADIESKTQLDQAVDKLIELTMTAVDKHTPLSRPCPYSKRWFTPMLKVQQREVNQARRRWQESCVRRGKEDPSTVRLLEEMRTRRR